MAKTKSTSFHYKCWFYLYCLTLLCYTPFLINFFWGNHDWYWIKTYTPLSSGIFEGRFSQFILPTILFSGNILPVLSIASGLLCFTYAAILLLKLWKIPEKYTLITGLFLTTAPYTLSWFYFAFLTLSCLSWTLVIIGAFYLINREKTPHLINYIISTLCFILALGGYPPVINMIGVIFFTLLIHDLCLKHSSLENIIKKYIPQALSVLIAALVIIFIQYLLKKYHFQEKTYNTAGIRLQDFLDNSLLCLKTSFSQFFHTVSFIEHIYKYGCCFLFILALIYLSKALPKKTSLIICFILSCFGLIISTNLTLLLTRNTIYVQNEPRIEFFGLVYIYVFAATILLQQKSRFIRNLTSILLIILICNNFASAAHCAKTWSLGFKAEAAQMERFIMRLEDNAQFNPHTKYTFIQSGTINMRNRYYTQNRPLKYDSYTLAAPYVPWHLPYKAYTFYYPEVFVENDFDVYWQFVSPYALSFSMELGEYLTLKAQPWPKPDAIFISPELIILTLTPKGRDLGAYWYNTHY